ncbi:hypothetical protein T484DRAFT_1758294 [Baffinella frigidus]|nr:hypothetical protein T484DRAFT_1758294 [Cryptophyta sp. CCMP2293]
MNKTSLKSYNDNMLDQYRRIESIIRELVGYLEKQPENLVKLLQQRMDITTLYGPGDFKQEYWESFDDFYDREIRLHEWQQFILGWCHELCDAQMRGEWHRDVPREEMFANEARDEMNSFNEFLAYQHQKKKDAELFLARTHPMARHNQELMYKGPDGKWAFKFWLLH